MPTTLNNIKHLLSFDFLDIMPSKKAKKFTQIARQSDNLREITNNYLITLLNFIEFYCKYFRQITGISCHWSSNDPSMKSFVVKLLFHIRHGGLLQPSIELAAPLNVRPVFASDDLLSMLASFCKATEFDNPAYIQIIPCFKHN